MGIPQKPINRIEQYLAGICSALGVEPDPEGGDDMKVLYFVEGANSTMVPRTGDSYATYEEYIESLESETAAVIPVYLAGRPVLECDQGTDEYTFLIADGITTVDSDPVLYIVSYTISTETETPGVYGYTNAAYTVALTAAE